MFFRDELNINILREFTIHVNVALKTTQNTEQTKNKFYELFLKIKL